MPKFFSPDRPVFDMPGAATTLGSLLAQFSEKYGSRFEPEGTDKYFRYYANAELPDYDLVDIHVTRGAVDICPKQDLDFALLSDDIVDAGALAC